MRRAIAPTAALAAMLALPRPGAADTTEAYLGEIAIFAGNYCPRGWARTDGQLVPVAGHEALFSLVGTFYGGDGRTTFGLPDLRSRTPVGTGRGEGLSNYDIGEEAGSERTRLTVANLPPHAHEVPLAGEARSGAGVVESGGQATGTAMTGPEGGSWEVPVRDPYQVVTLCIAMAGLYPSRE